MNGKKNAGNERKCTILPFPPITLKALVSVEGNLKGDVQMWHILLLFMIQSQDTVHASKVSVQQKD